MTRPIQVIDITSSLELLETQSVMLSIQFCMRTQPVLKVDLRMRSSTASDFSRRPAIPSVTLFLTI